MNKIFEDNKINIIKLDYLFYSVLSFILFIPGANLFYIQDKAISLTIRMIITFTI